MFSWIALIIMGLPCTTLTLNMCSMITMRGNPTLNSLVMLFPLSSNSRKMLHMISTWWMITAWMIYTTGNGNRDFAECKILCRVLKIGHSAKTFFAECYTRQIIALGKDGHSAKDFFAERQTLGKISTLGIGCPWKRRPVTAFFAERLQLGTRQRFVFF